MNDPQKPGLFSGIMALIGLIILIGIVVWGVLHLATLVAPSLSSLFRSAPTTTVSAPESAQQAVSPIAQQEAPRASTPSAAAQTKEAIATRPAAPADLRITIVSFSTDQSGNATLVFDIANIGGSASGGYSFTAQLPTTDSYAYSSVRQAPLGPGDHVLNTLRFSRAVAGTASVSVAYDDANAANNSASQTTGGAYNGSSYAQPAYYTQPASYAQPNYATQPYYQYQYNQPQPYYLY